MIKGTYAVLKLISGEEVIGAVIEESEYNITLMLPMVLRNLPKISPLNGMPVESLFFSPMCQMSADDTFVIDKAQTFFIKEMDPVYIPQYEDAIDKFLGTISSGPEPAVDEVQKLVDKINELHGSDLETKVTIDDELDYLDNMSNDKDKKLLH